MFANYLLLSNSLERRRARVVERENPNHLRESQEEGKRKEVKGRRERGRAQN